MSNEKTLNPDKIVELFGPNSIFYKKINEKINKVKNKKPKIFEKKLKLWKTIFYDIYNTDTNEKLFLKHSYYSSILYIILIIQCSKNKRINIKEAFENYISRNFDGFSSKMLLTFDWINIEQDMFQEIYKNLIDAHFIIEDLFHQFYQQTIQSSIRHSAGEFYTPSKLVNKMVDDSYKFGMKTLDGACGSGNFIMEIISKILKSNESEKAKFNAIEKIYGFDINPLAIYTLKINALIIFDEFMPKINLNKFSLNFYQIDSLFPESDFKKSNLNIKELYNSFDLTIGNPPWLTYKDLHNKIYQKRIRNLAKRLKIKPKSQYITHIELASIFFYSTPMKFLKPNGIIFFVVTKSLINGDHCKKFRAFWIFENLEIWDFIGNSYFNIRHICLKARYIDNQNRNIQDKYPISAKIFDDKMKLKKETEYSSLKVEEDGALIILPQKDLVYLSNIQYSTYKKRFYQGATLVPRSLVFFKVDDRINNSLIISSSEDILTRSKKKWRFKFERKRIEEKFRFKTFLNKDLVPFFLKQKRNVFLPINKIDFNFDVKYLEKYPYASKFYREMNEIYQKRKKSTSDINTLFSNLNYWNKLTKQVDLAPYLVIYNASGSYLKSAVIEQLDEKIIVGSENYYYSTHKKNEAYYLCAILNTPLLTKYIKLIKSSRHIHKRPFSFPIPIYDENNKNHYKLSQKGKKYTSYVHDIVYNNPQISSRKVRLILNQNFQKLNSLTKRTVFK